MISLIICSRTKSLNPALKNNIAETIGTEHEIVLIDNSDNKYSIFQAYNSGAEQSRYPYLCFMHDDIIYHTKNWGKKVLKHFEDENTGAIGIAGSPYATYMPGSWWGGGLVSQYYLLAGNADDDPVTSTYKAAGISNEVVVLDGVWICVRKPLFNQISFDSTSYSGFHFYDADISLQIHEAGYKLYSVFDVLIRHYTYGKTTINWCENALIFNKKWISKLPVSCIRLTYPERCEAELKTLKECIHNMLAYYPYKATYRFAILKLLNYRYGYLYYKTPLHILKYCIKYFLKSPYNA